MPARNRRRTPQPSVDYRCVCGYPLQRFWSFCPDCARPQRWPDTAGLAGAECPRCRVINLLNPATLDWLLLEAGTA